MADNEKVESASVDLSYEQVVDLLVHKKQVPGIVDIPDTVLGPKSGSESRAPPRPKPWETTAENEG